MHYTGHCPFFQQLFLAIAKRAFSGYYKQKNFNGCLYSGAQRKKMNLRFLIISIAISLLVTAIVIHSTHGRISRKRYWKIEATMVVGFVSYWFFTFFLLAFFLKNFSHSSFFYSLHVLHTLLFIIGFFGTFVFLYKHWQLQILRLHDMNKSGWYCLLSYIPIYGFYDFFVMLFRKRRCLMNEFDEPIDYYSFFEKNKFSTNFFSIFLQTKILCIRGLHSFHLPFLL